MVALRLGLLCQAAALAQAQRTSVFVAVHKVAEWEIKEVATLSVASNLPGLPGASLVGTTFGPFGKDCAFAVGPLTAGQYAKVAVLSDEFSWPNEAYQLSEETKAKANLSGALVVVADGFLFPLKQTGGIHLLKVGQGLQTTKTTISTDKHAWFYHHSEWMDVDMDGVFDVVAARATKPFLVGHTDAEFVWIKNHGNGTWGETQVMMKGPGVGFKVVDMDADGRSEIVATEFFLHQQLSIFHCPEGTWAECATKRTVVETVIDSDDGPFFQASWVDLNGDGKKDILATAQQFTKDEQVIPGKVLAFEQPSSLIPGCPMKWTRHVLADGYLPQPRQPQGSGAPGVATAFVMDTSKGGKPHLVLTGDDGGVVDLLAPLSEEPDDWAYSKQTLYTSEGTTEQGVRTIGTVLTADIDGSGRPELFIASYAENKLLMYTFDACTSAIVV
mmetsp:Transcript_6519/g.16203  ORF Transcript_6519/g.16203 Transcript_6519/m.16203 type:complete len:444 (+) Transcript_6519:38-1369(+)